MKRVLRPGNGRRASRLSFHLFPLFLSPVRMPLIRQILRRYRSRGHDLREGVQDNVCQRSGIRWGADIGGRWGSVKADFNEINHRTAPAESLFGSIHSDLEYPVGHCILQAGIRGQFGVIWTDIIQVQNPKQFQTLDVMVTFGGRF